MLIKVIRNICALIVFSCDFGVHIVLADDTVDLYAENVVSPITGKPFVEKIDQDPEGEFVISELTGLPFENKESLNGVDEQYNDNNIEVMEDPANE